MIMKKLLIHLFALALCASCATMSSRNIKGHGHGYPDRRCRLTEDRSENQNCSCAYDKNKRFKPNRFRKFE